MGRYFFVWAISYTKARMKHQKPKTSLTKYGLGVTLTGVATTVLTPIYANWGAEHGAGIGANIGSWLIYLAGVAICGVGLGIVLYARLKR